MPRPKLDLRLRLSAIALSALLGITNVYAQTSTTDYFPRYAFDLNWSPFYLSFIQPLDDDENFTPILGSGFNFELYQLNADKALYAALQFDVFGASTEGKESIKWRRTDIDMGLRLNMAMSFMGRPNAKFFLGTGYSRLHLKKRDARYEKVRERVEGKLVVRDVDVSLITKWDGHGAFFEAGQIVPLELNHTPFLNLVWALKYEHSLSGSELNLGGVSFAFGFGFTFSYRK